MKCPFCGTDVGNYEVCTGCHAVRKVKGGGCVPLIVLFLAIIFTMISFFSLYDIYANGWIFYICLSISIILWFILYKQVIKFSKKPKEYFWQRTTLK